MRCLGHAAAIATRLKGLLVARFGTGRAELPIRRLRTATGHYVRVSLCHPSRDEQQEREAGGDKVAPPDSGLEEGVLRISRVVIYRHGTSDGIAFRGGLGDILKRRDLTAVGVIGRKISPVGDVVFIPEQRLRGTRPATVGVEDAALDGRPSGTADSVIHPEGAEEKQ